MAASKNKDSLERFFNMEFERYLVRNSNRLDVTNRKQRILAAGIQEHFVSGFQAASMAEIAKRAGVSTATLYRLYPDKQTLSAEAYGMAMEMIGSWMHEESLDPNPLVRLTTMLTRQILGVCHPAIQTAMASHFSFMRHNKAAFKEPAVSFFDQNIHFWVSACRRLQQEGFLRPPTEDATEADRVAALAGPLEAMTIIPNFLVGRSLISEDDLLEEAAEIIDGFFKLYGTAQFHAARKAHNWDGELAGYIS